MTFARRLLLVGTDHRFGQSVQTHLHKTFLLTAPVVRFDDLSQLLSRDTDGVLVFLASDAADAEKIASATREIRLQELPPRMAVLESHEFSTARRSEPFVAPVDARFRWSDQHKELNQWVRASLTPGVAFVDPASETPAERVRRRLLSLTPSLTHLIDQLDIAATHDVTVLIEGETGTGKTHLAKLIHDCSPRAGNRFLVVACGALSGNLIASEFFGHVKGAFTGADVTKVGKFAAAGHGTILLDEIDTLAIDQQANLLRVIETGEYEPVGSNETQVSSARLVVATNWNLSEAVERGTFRRDLYYRLHVITFHLPALRERPQDIGPLVRGMVARYGSRFGKKIEAVHADALRALEAFSWPGNIRQLENVVQQAVLTCTKSELNLEHLSPIIRTRSAATVLPTPSDGANSLVQNRETTERTVIIRALEKSSFSRTRAAQMLGVSRVTLYKKMKKYGLLTKAPPYFTLGNDSPLRPSGI